MVSRDHSRACSRSCSSSVLRRMRKADDSSSLVSCISSVSMPPRSSRRASRPPDNSAVRSHTFADSSPSLSGSELARALQKDSNCSPGPERCSRLRRCSLRFRSSSNSSACWRARRRKSSASSVPPAASNSASSRSAPCRRRSLASRSRWTSSTCSLARSRSAKEV